MKVVFKQSISSVDRSFACKERADIDETLAKQWQASGYLDIIEGNDRSVGSIPANLKPESETKTCPKKNSKRK